MVRLAGLLNALPRVPKRVGRATQNPPASSIRSVRISSSKALRITQYEQITPLPGTIFPAISGNAAAGRLTHTFAWNFPVFVTATIMRMNESAGLASMMGRAHLAPLALVMYPASQKGYLPPSKIAFASQMFTPQTIGGGRFYQSLFTLLQDCQQYIWLPAAARYRGRLLKTIRGFSWVAERSPGYMTGCCGSSGRKR